MSHFLKLKTIVTFGQGMNEGERAKHGSVGFILKAQKTTLKTADSPTCIHLPPFRSTVIIGARERAQPVLFLQTRQPGQVATRTLNYQVLSYPWSSLLVVVGAACVQPAKTCILAVSCPPGYTRGDLKNDDDEDDSRLYHLR